MKTMICQPCLTECERKGNCWGGEDEFLCPCGQCGCEDNQPDNCLCSEPCFLYKDKDHHDRAEHGMSSRPGGFARCDQDHEKEIPADAMMHAAGATALL